MNESSCMKNIVLIGMPGCGKTTVGQILANNLGRRFVDCDLVLEKAAALTIPEIFQREGEEGFRIRETQILKETCGQSGLVIATGGGCVTREENYPHLKHNGIIVYLERPLALLAREGRPLSSGNMETMYQHRLPLYRHFADLTILNDESADSTAKNIFEVLDKNNAFL